VNTATSGARTQDLAPDQAPDRAGVPTILVVEDELLVRRMLRTFLEGRGYEVVTVEDGLGALERLYGAEPPALVILDLALPRVSGWKFLQRRTYDAVLAAVPVIVLSGCSDLSEVSARARDVPLLTKPVDLRMLGQLVDELCAGRLEG
jgi:CheY-like chemotaxis protein